MTYPNDGVCPPRMACVIGGRTLFPLFFLFFLGCFAFPAMAKELPPEPLTRPYPLSKTLIRAEDCYKNNNYREALIYYYEALDEITDPEVKSKVHFRLGECLEGVKRYDYAAFHYKVAGRGRLPALLASRVLTKLQHLPELAQHEEAMRLYNKSMASYKKRDVRGAIDDYLASIRLEPSLMAKDDSHLIDDAIQYLTCLTESKDREPRRLLKLAALLELRGEMDKALETYKQILIIYPHSKEAREAENKVEFETEQKNSYFEITKPGDALKEVVPRETPTILETDLEFIDPGGISKELPDCAYTLKAFNEQSSVPIHRFDSFIVTLGRGENQKEFLFRAEEGVTDKSLSFDDGTAIYKITFREVNLTTAYVQDIYGEGPRPVQLFTRIKLNLVVTRK